MINRKFGLILAFPNTSVTSSWLVCVVQFKSWWWMMRYEIWDENIYAKDDFVSYSVSRIFYCCPPSQKFPMETKAKTKCTEVLSGKAPQESQHLGWSKSDVEMISAQTDELKISHNVPCNVACKSVQTCQTHRNDNSRQPLCASRIFFWGLIIKSIKEKLL